MNTPDETYQRVEEALDAMRRAMTGARERLGAGLQLSRTQLEILMLMEETAWTTGELARRLYLSPSAVTQTIDTLVRRELITRHPDEADRRIIRLELSPEGRRLTTHLRDQRREKLQAFVSSLNPNEIDMLITLTHKMATLISERNQ